MTTQRDMLCHTLHQPLVSPLHATYNMQGLHSTFNFFNKAVQEKKRAYIWACECTLQHVSTHTQGHNTELAREYKREGKFVQVRRTPVCFDETHAGYAAVIGLEVGFSLCGFCLPRDTPTTPWHPWHGAFHSDWWPRMTDSILHAYNRLMRPAAAPRDREVMIRNVKKIK